MATPVPVTTTSLKLLTSCSSVTDTNPDEGTFTLCLTKPIDDISNTGFAVLTFKVKDPSVSEIVAALVPLTMIEAPGTGLASVELTTLPVIVPCE